MQNKQLYKYFSDDTVFNIINKKFISLQDDEVKRNNVYLNKVITTLIEEMKLEDPLFEATYKEIIFSGSFYKGTKVGHPNEFDLNVILELPLNCSYKNFIITRPGFVQIFVDDDAFLFNKPKYNNLPTKKKRLLNTFICNGYLNPDKFRDWIEGIISKVINKLPKCQNGHELIVKDGNFWFYSTIKVKKSGPAFTLIINIHTEDDDIHVDLAPALAFRTYLLNGYFKKLNEGYRNETWYAIPLPLTNSNHGAIKEIHWRFSFCNQEKELLSKYGRMKPVIRQMKKLRDTQNWKSIASYYVETLFLNKLNELEKDLNKIPLTLYFYVMLKELCRVCERHKIEYFWDERNNLLEKIQHIEMFNIVSRLNNIIKSIEKNAAENKFILAEYILDKNELQLLIKEYNRQTISNNESLNEDLQTDTSQKNGWNCMIL